MKLLEYHFNILIAEFHSSQLTVAYRADIANCSSILVLPIRCLRPLLIKALCKDVKNFVHRTRLLSDPAGGETDIKASASNTSTSTKNRSKGRQSRVGLICARASSSLITHHRVIKDQKYAQKL